MGSQNSRFHSYFAQSRESMFPFTVTIDCVTTDCAVAEAGSLDAGAWRRVSSIALSPFPAATKRIHAISVGLSA
jgi:hypothetical protein